MATQIKDELREFHRFLSDKLHNGGADWSPEQALDEWRRLHPDTQADANEVVAIGEALSDRENGDQGMPFADFDREFRERHHLPSQP